MTDPSVPDASRADPPASDVPASDVPDVAPAPPQAGPAADGPRPDESRPDEARPDDARPAGPGGADAPAPLPDPLHDPLPGSGALDRLAARARDYARGAISDNTARAYAADWAAWVRWCRRHGAAPLPPRPDLVGLYLAELAAPAPHDRRPRTRPSPGLSVASIERRLSGLSWGCTQRGHRLERADRHIATVLAGIRRRHARPPVQKDAVSAGDLRAMIATLGHDLRGIRDRAILLLGFAGGLRRSEITGLDVARPPHGGTTGGTTADGITGGGTGWIAISPEGVLLTLRGKTGWREVAVGRGSAPITCPVQTLETWLRFARIDPADPGPLFRRTSRDGTRALPDRLAPQHVALLVKRTALAAGLRADLPEAERRALFSGHSLRAGLASHAAAEERHIQKHLGHASVDMTRRYQRNRDRFAVNLTKAAGL